MAATLSKIDNSNTVVIVSEFAPITAAAKVQPTSQPIVFLILPMLHTMS